MTPCDQAITRFLQTDRPLDCDEGRRLGCGTYCCSLIVRLDPDECDPGDDRPGFKHCVDKDPDGGRCIFLDDDQSSCTVYSRRPRVCRQYDCRTDPLLKVVLQEGFHSLTRLVTSPLLDDKPR